MTEAFRKHISSYVQPDLRLRRTPQYSTLTTRQILLNSGKDTDMVGTLKAGFRFARRPAAVIATVLLVGLSGQAFARGTGFNSGFGAEVAAPGTSPGEVGGHIERAGIRHRSPRLTGNHHNSRQRWTGLPDEQRQRHKHADCARGHPSDSGHAKMTQPRRLLTALAMGR